MNCSCSDIPAKSSEVVAAKQVYEVKCTAIGPCFDRMNPLNCFIVLLVVFAQ
jgi:hypothetical protein